MNFSSLTTTLLGVPLVAALCLAPSAEAHARPQFADQDDLMAEDATDLPGAERRSQGKAKKRNRRGKAGKLCQRLQCTPEQRSKLAELKQAQRKARAQHRAEIKRLRQQLQVEFKAERLNRRAVDRIFAKIQDQREAMAAVQAETLAAIHPILTPEQRQRFANDMNRRPNRGKRGAKRSRRK